MFTNKKLRAGCNWLTNSDWSLMNKIKKVLYKFFYYAQSVKILDFLQKSTNYVSDLLLFIKMRQTI